MLLSISWMLIFNLNLKKKDNMLKEISQSVTGLLSPHHYR